MIVCNLDIWNGLLIKALIFFPACASQKQYLDISLIENYVLNCFIYPFNIRAGALSVGQALGWAV